MITRLLAPPPRLQLPAKLSLPDGKIFDIIPQLCRGSASVHIQSLLAGSYKPSNNNRTNDQFEKHLLREFFEKVYNATNIGDVMRRHLLLGKVKMQEGPNGPQESPSTFFSHFDVFWAHANSAFVGRKKGSLTFDDKVEALHACFPQRYRLAIEAHPTLDIYDPDEYDTLQSFLEDKHEEDRQSGQLQRIADQQKRLKEKAAAEQAAKKRAKAQAACS